jgi:hypothetical protein
VTPINRASTTEEMPLLELTIKYIACNHFHVVQEFVIKKSCLYILRQLLNNIEVVKLNPINPEQLGRKFMDCRF